MLERAVSYMRRWLNSPVPRPHFGFRPSSELARLLEIERQRADRSGGSFSLVTFTPADERLREATLQCLEAILQRRLRMTDHTGWRDDRRVAAILPMTRPAGAWTVANDVCAQFPADVPRPQCTVQSYPNLSDAEIDTIQEEGLLRHAKPKSSEAIETLFVIATPRWKRALDVLGAGAGLILLSPILLVVAALIKLTSPGPVFFTQWRSGRGGQKFRIYKFRSMVVDADRQKARLMAMNEQDGPAFKVKNDPRITGVGRFLRTTSIDELPQLWNVLRGDMSLVGPRPLPCNESNACDSWQRRRLDVTPGLTCIWQVKGRSRVTFDEWIRMDIRYIRSRALWNDLKLIVQTVPAVVRRKGAH